MRLQLVYPHLVQTSLAWLTLRARLAQLTACQLAALIAMRSQPMQPRLVQTRLTGLILGARLAQRTAC